MRIRVIKYVFLTLLLESISCCVACEITDAAISRRLNFPRTVEIQLDDVIAKDDKVPIEIIEALKNQGKLTYISKVGGYQILPESYDANIVTPRMDLNYDFHGVRIKLLTANLAHIDRLKSDHLNVAIKYDFLEYFKNSSKLAAGDVVKRFELPTIRSAVINPTDCSVHFTHN